MAGLTPLFNLNLIRASLKEKFEEYDRKTLEALQYAGEEFVNKARLVRTYFDDTGNLRSSIGYVILKDGKVIYQNFRKAADSTDGELGVLEGMNLANDLAKEHPHGFVLIGLAGMNYAAAVESRGYDVITGSDPSGELKSILNEIKW